MGRELSRQGRQAALEAFCSPFPLAAAATTVPTVAPAAAAATTTAATFTTAAAPTATRPVAATTPAVLGFGAAAALSHFSFWRFCYS